MGGVTKYLKRSFPERSDARWLVSGFYRTPFGFLVALLRSVAASWKLTGTPFPIRVRVGVGQKLHISKNKTATVSLKGVLTVTSWGGSFASSSINCGPNAKLHIEGDFEVGPNVHISVAKTATLIVGGKRESSCSGITADSRIMVERCVSIGADCIIAWDVLITDSNWHNIKGSVRVADVVIGDKCWLAHGVSVLKGAAIPSGSVVGAKSVVSNQFQDENSLLFGVPAKVVRKNIEWSR